MMLMASLLESTTAPQLYSRVGSTCLCPPGTILVQDLCKLMTMEEKGVEFAFTAVRGVTVREHACAVMTEGRSYRQRTWLVDS